jgi:LysR family transcriptional regulator, low CO2-responsive transcriptional regulator
MRLSQLRSFIAVAQAGSISAAARQLLVSQPTLTTQVRLLEEKYGVELFHRLARGVVLTDTGRRLFELTGQLASIENDALQLLKDAGDLRSGRLIVGAVSPYQVTDMLAQFSHRYPAMGVKVRFGNSEFVLGELLNFRIDVGVLAHFAAEPRLHVLPYSRDPIVAFVSRDHSFSKFKSIRIEQLQGQRMVVRESGSTARKAMDAALARARVTPVVVMELDSREAIREAVAKGIGIGTVAEAAYTPDTRLHMLRFSNANAWTETHVFCLQVRRTARVVSVFLNIAEELSRAKAVTGATAKGKARRKQRR